MNEIVYLEPSEEITSVIDRIRKATSDGLSLVIPRGSSIAQSIVNLKLLKKSADELKKEISLVSNDRITRNLASQIGLTVYTKVSEAERAIPAAATAVEDLSSKKEEEPESNKDYKVNSYYHKKQEEDEDEDEAEEDSSSEPESQGNNRDNNKNNDRSDNKFGHNTSEPRRKDDNYDHHDRESEEEPQVEKSPFNSREISPERKNYNNNFGKPVPKKNPGGSRKPLVIILACFAVILGVSLGLFLPYAEASIQIKTENKTVSKDVNIDQNQTKVDVDNLTISGKIVEVDKDSTKTFDATGTKDEGTKASGTVTVYSTVANPVTVPSGSKFIANGKTFISQSAVVLPAAIPGSSNSDCKQVGSLWQCTTKGDVTVVASGNGDSYNIAAATFTIGNYSSSNVYGKSIAAMSGGTTKNVKIVTADDLTKAEASLKKDVDSSSKSDLTTKAKDQSLTTIDATMKSEIASSTSSKNENDEADTFSYTLKMKEYVLSFSEKDVQSVMKSYSEKSLASDKMIVNPDKTDVTYKVKKSDIDSGTAVLNATVVNRIGQKMVEADIKNQIANKSVSKATEILKQNSNITDVSIKMWPSFFNRLPFLKNRIKITFDYTE